MPDLPAGFDPAMALSLMTPGLDAEVAAALMALPADKRATANEMLAIAASDVPLAQQRAQVVDPLTRLATDTALPATLREHLLRTLGWLSPFARQSPLRLMLAERAGRLPQVVTALRAQLPRLLPALDDADEDVVYAAAWAIAHTGSPDAVPALRARLDRDAGPRVRVSLLLALAWCGGHSQRDYLVQLVANESMPVVGRVAAVLSVCRVFEGKAPGECARFLPQWLTMLREPLLYPAPVEDARWPWSLLPGYPVNVLTWLDPVEATGVLLAMLRGPSYRDVDEIVDTLLRWWLPWSGAPGQDADESASESDGDMMRILGVDASATHSSIAPRRLTARQQQVMRDMLAARTEWTVPTFALVDVPASADDARRWLAECAEQFDGLRHVNGVPDPLILVEPPTPDPAADSEAWLRPHQLVASPLTAPAMASVSPRSALVGCVFALELALRTVAQCVPAERATNDALSTVRDAMLAASRYAGEWRAERDTGTARLTHQLRIIKRTPPHPALGSLAAAALQALEFAPTTAGHDFPPSDPLSGVLDQCAIATAIARAANPQAAPMAARRWEFLERWSCTFRRRLAFVGALDGLFDLDEPPTTGVSPPIDDNAAPPPELMSLPGAVMEFAEDDATLRLASGRHIERARLRGSD